MSFCNWEGVAKELAEKIAALESELESSRQEIERLKAEVKDWLCVKCRTVYGGPPQQGTSCVVCPKCGGDTGPRATTELRAERQSTRELLETLRDFAEHGVRHDLNPTGKFKECGHFEVWRDTGQYLSYMKSIEAYVKGKARDALARHKAGGKAT